MGTAQLTPVQGRDVALISLRRGNLHPTELLLEPIPGLRVDDQHGGKKRSTYEGLGLAR